jgi:hypothetical protein
LKENTKKKSLGRENDGDLKKERGREETETFKKVKDEGEKTGGRKSKGDP